MVDVLIKENKLDAAQEVQLYLSILLYQEKYKEALEFLDTPLCIQIYPSVPIQERIDLLKKVGKWADCNILLKKLMKEK